MKLDSKYECYTLYHLLLITSFYFWVDEWNVINEHNLSFKNNNIFIELIFNFDGEKINSFLCHYVLETIDIKFCWNCQGEWTNQDATKMTMVHTITKTSF